MQYQEYQPANALRPYIDAYWTSESARACEQRIFPDCCSDIIFNTGPVAPLVNGNLQLLSGKTYLVGTMSAFSEVSNPAGSRLLGIRFKPGAFHAFFHFPLADVTDGIVEFGALKPATPAALNDLLLARLRPVNPVIPALMETLGRHHGQVAIATLAKAHYLTIRTLERLVKQHTGLTVKQLAGIFRFRNVLQKLRRHNGHENLQALAFDSGYYDHAHLGNEVRRYTGLTPSALMFP